MAGRCLSCLYISFCLPPSQFASTECWQCCCLLFLILGEADCIETHVADCSRCCRHSWLPASHLLVGAVSNDCLSHDALQCSKDYTLAAVWAGQSSGFMLGQTSSAAAHFWFQWVKKHGPWDSGWFLCNTQAVGNELHYVFDCPRFVAIRAQYSNLFQDAEGSMRLFIWHKDQKTGSHCLIAILQMAQT